MRFNVNDVDILSCNLRAIKITNIINILKFLFSNSSCSLYRYYNYLFVKNSRVDINCEKINIVVLKIKLSSNKKFEEDFSKTNFSILILFFLVSYFLLLKSTRLFINFKIINFLDRSLILFNSLNIYRNSTSKLISFFEN